MTLRYCPLCDADVEGMLCATHDVPTVDPRALRGPGAELGEGDLVDGRYRIVRLLGRGGMGAVYLATQLDVQRSVAIKILAQAGDLPLVRRFYREVRALGGLSHPNIVRIFDFGVDPATHHPYLAMEWVDGLTLSAWVSAAGAVAERPAARLGAGIARALEAAHAAGFVHRDLKPENVMLRVHADGSQDVVVLDFGIARALDGSDAVTATGARIGTPRYMSPEQASGQPATPASDLYALGGVLHFLCTAAPPYEGRDVATVLAAHRRAPLPVLPARLSDGRAPSRELSSLHRALLRKDPGHRPATAAAVATRLDAMARGHRPRPRRVAVWVLGALVLAGLGLAWWTFGRGTGAAGVGELPVPAGPVQVPTGGAGPAPPTWRTHTPYLQEAMLGNGPHLHPALSPDGNALAFSNGRDVLLWTEAGGTLSVTGGQVPDAREPAFSPDGQRLAVASARGIVVVDGEGAMMTTVAGQGASPAWSPDGASLAVAGAPLLDVRRAGAADRGRGLKGGPRAGARTPRLPAGLVAGRAPPRGLRRWRALDHRRGQWSQTPGYAGGPGRVTGRGVDAAVWPCRALHLLPARAGPGREHPSCSRGPASRGGNGPPGGHRLRDPRRRLAMEHDRGRGHVRVQRGHRPAGR